MVRTLVRKSYPLLKFLLPLAALVLVVGLTLFFMHTATCTQAVKDNGEDCTVGGTYADHPTMVLLPWVVVAALLALGSLLWRRHEKYTLVFPTDQLSGKSRAELEKVLQGLDEARAKGDITQDRYTKARDRVLAEMNTTKK
ncbi:MAG TPA: hypothetical protein VM286_01760 [Candidatus Thermoplasmatota archaeon]|nr:hypothetical protein [Candidatus Thermoplasmatota archaeon]